jgi:hypothetical protein
VVGRGVDVIDVIDRSIDRCVSFISFISRSV